MVELILKLLDNEQLLSLFEKVVRERSIVTWPTDPKDEEEKALLTPPARNTLERWL